MNLEAGSQLGVYTIVGPLGSGGMGEVYRATDINLDREVAIKVLPDSMACDPERVARFQREAKLLASLNHPQIGAIYRFDQAESRQFLVLELVEGPTLADSLAKGPLPIEEALDIGKQIAQALEAAHEKGIIHRDLKPNNVKITPDGQVKVLDFGLAKALLDEASNVDPRVSPTISAEFTRPGAILGTAAYMSPEQARGMPVDQRSDIWAFGCVFYECLTGNSPFLGPTMTDSIAALLQEQPDWGRLPADTPPSVRRLLRRCLSKDPRQRLHHIADARLDLEAVADPELDSVESDAQRRSKFSTHHAYALVAATILVSLVIVAWLIWLAASPDPQRPRHEFTLLLEGTSGLHASIEESLESLALSPDGEKLVYMADSDGKPSLLMSNLRRAETKVLLNATARGIFFSPDGQWICFENGGKLKTLRLNGGQVETLCDVAAFHGGTWAPDGTIFFVPSLKGGIWRIPATGGEAEQVTRPLTDQGEFGHWQPHIISDGSALLFTAWRKTLSDSQVVVLSLKTNERKVLCERASQPRYSPTGHLTYARSGTLMAVRLDVENLELGPPHFPLADDLLHSFLDGRAVYFFSDDELLLYVRGSAWKANRRIVWVDREGKVAPVPIPADAYGTVSLSPSGQKLAFQRFDGDSASVGVHDLASGATTQLPSDTFDISPVWVGEEQLAFTSFPDGPFDIYIVPADLSTMARPLVKGEVDQAVAHASANGDRLFYLQTDPHTGFDVWSLSTEDQSPISADGNHLQEPLLNERYTEAGIVLSPDEEFIAFSSNRTGRDEIYVQRLSATSGPRQVSRNGGFEPRWARDGRQLFYRSTNDLWSVTFQSDKGTILLGRPQLLFSTRGFISPRPGHSYDVGTDGRFLFIEDRSPPRLIAVVNWFDNHQAGAR